MKRLDTLLKNLQSFRPEVVVMESLREDKKPLLDANREQLSKGVKTDNSAVGKYATSTIYQRRRKGLQTSFVDLKDSEDLYKGLDFYVSAKEATFFSRVPYAKYHVGRYVTEPKGHIYGVTDENLKKAVKEVYLKIIIQKTKNHLFNGM